MPIRVRRADGSVDIYEAGSLIGREQTATTPWGPGAIPDVYLASFIAGRGHERVSEWDVGFALQRAYYDRQADRDRERQRARAAGLEGDETQGRRAGDRSRDAARSG